MIKKKRIVSARRENKVMIRERWSNDNKVSRRKMERKIESYTKMGSCNSVRRKCLEEKKKEERREKSRKKSDMHKMVGMSSVK